MDLKEREVQILIDTILATKNEEIEKLKMSIAAYETGSVIDKKRIEELQYPMPEYVSVQEPDKQTFRQFLDTSGCACEYYDRMGCCAPEKVSTEYCSTCGHTFGDRVEEKEATMDSRIEKIRKFWNSEYVNPREKEDVDFLLAEVDRLRKLVAEDEARLNAAEKEIA